MDIDEHSVMLYMWVKAGREIVIQEIFNPDTYQRMAQLSGYTALVLRLSRLDIYVVANGPIDAHQTRQGIDSYLWRSIPDEDGVS